MHPAVVPRSTMTARPSRDASADRAGVAGDTVLATFDRDVLLATGRTVHIRPSRPADAPAVRDFYAHLSDRSRYLRRFGSPPESSDDHQLLPGNDIYDRVSLLALDDSVVIGIGEYLEVGETADVEVAFAVADSHQHEGVATLLLEDLAVIARAAGFHRLVAETLSGNGPMLTVFRTVGLVEHVWHEQGQVHIEMDLSGEDLLEDRADDRDWTAARTSLRPLFSPAHVVVIGAGRRPTSAGRAVLAELVGSFQGRVSVVHPTETVIGSVPAVADVAQLDPVPDLAIVVVPAAKVVEVVDECGRAGIPAVVVISAGFAETGGTGVERERELLATARRHGMRLVGPNCLGVVSTGVGLNATFLRRPMVPGSIAIGSQSGGVGIVLAAEAARRQLGVSSFVSLGNKADVSGNDVLRYWADDPETAVILLYLESIGDPLRFARIARAVSRRRPIVALKSGRSEAGERGARSHTAALATDDVAVEALFAYTGVVRAETLDQLLDVGALLAEQPAPAGRRVALVGNTGGPLILAADAAVKNGLEVVELSAHLQQGLRRIVPDAASTSNPVDLLATATPAATGRVLEEIAGSGEVDAVAVVSIALDGEATTALHLDWTDPCVPAVGVLLGGLEGAGTMPTYPTPERAMDALGLAAGRGTWLAATSEEQLTASAIDPLRLRREVRQWATTADPATGPGRPAWLGPAETFALFEHLGVPMARSEIATSARECARAAQRVGFPCVLKADAAGLVHKSDEGGVVLGVRSTSAVRRVFGEFTRQFGDRLRHVVVQHQAEPGFEFLIGAVRDPSIGPLVVVSSGGAEAELFGDRRVLLAPVTAARARGALEQLRSYPLLRGFRGRPVVPVEPIVEIIERIGRLMVTVPEVAELDLNPVIATTAGAVAVDARVALAPQVTRPLRALSRPRATPPRTP